MAWFDECVDCQVVIRRGKTPTAPPVCKRGHRMARQLNPDTPGKNGVGLGELRREVEHFGLRLVGDEPAGWWKISRNGQARVYFERRADRDPVRVIHLFGFHLDHPAVQQISRLAATEFHRTSVTGIIRFDGVKAEGLAALRLALRTVARP